MSLHRQCGQGQPCHYPQCTCNEAVPVWPFPRSPEQQAQKAREHQAQQRRAIVEGQEALL